jgi:hypothetical protein
MLMYATQFLRQRYSAKVSRVMARAHDTCHVTGGLDHR